MIRIEEITPDTLPLLDVRDPSFTATERLVPALQNGGICYTFEPLPVYHKDYPKEDLDYQVYIRNKEQTIFLAFVEDNFAGQMRLRVNWNHFGYIEDIAVQPGFRRQGVGSALIQQAIVWAKTRQLPGLTLETQDINTPACRFYARCGFRLMGLDQSLYKGIDGVKDEVALYWYVLF